MNISQFANTSEFGGNWQFFHLHVSDTYQHWKIVQMTFILGTFLYTFAANGLIVLTIFSNSELRITANIFIAAHLISDLAQIVIYSISNYIGLIQGGFWLNQKICLFQSGAITTFRTFTFVLLVLMSLEKMVYIIYPFKHERFFKKRYVYCYIIILLCLNTVFMVLIAIFQQSRFDEGFLCCESLWKPTLHSQGITTAIFISLVMIIVISQVNILIFAIKENLKIRQQTARFNEDQITKRMLKRAIFLFLVIVLYGSSRTSYYLMRFFPENLIARRIVIYFVMYVTPVLNSITFLMQNKPIKQKLFSRFTKTKPELVHDIRK